MVSPANPPPALPSQFLCPITLEFMDQPTCAGDGATYQRTAIQTYFDTFYETHPRHELPLSPWTHQVLPHTHLAPNLSLVSLMHDHPVARPMLRAAQEARRAQQPPAVAPAPQAPHPADSSLERAWDFATMTVGACFGAYVGDRLGWIAERGLQATVMRGYSFTAAGPWIGSMWLGAAGALLGHAVARHDFRPARIALEMAVPSAALVAVSVALAVGLGTVVVAAQGVGAVMDSTPLNIIAGFHNGATLGVILGIALAAEYVAVRALILAWQTGRI